MWPFKQEADWEKTCKQCHYFNEYVYPDRLLPDKTVIRGGVSRWECSRGRFELNNLTTCELFENNPGWKNRIALPTLRIPRTVACGGSATPEPIKEWVRQQADLSPKEQAEIAEDLETYFRLRRERIAAQEKL